MATKVEMRKQGYSSCSYLPVWFFREFSGKQRHRFFFQQVSLTTSRQASATEQLINQRQKCPDTVVFYWAAWNFLASNGQRGRLPASR